MALKKKPPKIDPMDSRVKEVTYFSNGRVRSVTKYDEPKAEAGFVPLKEQT